MIIIISMKTNQYENVFQPYNGIIGIVNSGCSCYLNSMLQCLSKTTQFSSIFLNDNQEDKNSWIYNVNEKEDSKFIYEFKDLIKVLWNHRVNNDTEKLEIINDKKDLEKDDSINIKNLEVIIKEKYPYLFEPPFQQDSSEVLIYLLECIHNGLSKEVDMKIISQNTPRCDLEKLQIKAYETYMEYFKKDYSLIVKLFYGISISIIRVNGRNIESTKFDTYSMFPLSIPQKLKIDEEIEIEYCSLHDCFMENQKPDYLDGDNKWYHEGTDMKYDATKVSKIFKPPPILVLHLKRYGYMEREVNGKTVLDYNIPIKNNTLVKFPFDLNISKYIYNKNVLDNPSDCLYELYATSNHLGSPHGGHFFANCKIEDKWFCYDDDNVNLIDKPEKIINNRALVLFYRRKNL
jgi:ubiquitin C-terminal hydrolase